MAMTQYDPFRELQHRLFHQHFEQPYGRGGQAEQTQSVGSTWSPLVDFFEDSEGITLKVELPEVDAKDVSTSRSRATR